MGWRRRRGSASLISRSLARKRSLQVFLLRRNLPRIDFPQISAARVGDVLRHVRKQHVPHSAGRHEVLLPVTCAGSALVSVFVVRAARTTRLCPRGAASSSCVFRRILHFSSPDAGMVGKPALPLSTVRTIEGME